MCLIRDCKMSLSDNKLCSVVLVLTVAVITSAACADTNCDTYIFATQHSNNISALSACYNTDIRLVSSGFAEIGRRLRTPPAESTKPNKAGSVTTLPDIPKTLMLALTGFICVSLFKDRRFWLTVLRGLLWTGQSGIQLLPQMAESIKNARQDDQKKYTCPAGSISDVNFSRPRCCVEGSLYIGLLHHLEGIPETDTDNSIRYDTVSPNSQRSFGSTYHLLNNDSQSAITPRQYGLSLRSKCLTPAGHPLVFSPCFTSRGTITAGQKKLPVRESLFVKHSLLIFECCMLGIRSLIKRNRIEKDLGQ